MKKWKATPIDFLIHSLRKKIGKEHIKNTTRCRLDDAQSRINISGCLILQGSLKRSKHHSPARASCRATTPHQPNHRTSKRQPENDPHQTLPATAIKPNAITILLFIIALISGSLSFTRPAANPPKSKTTFCAKSPPTSTSSQLPKSQKSKNDARIHIRTSTNTPPNKKPCEASHLPDGFHTLTKPTATTPTASTSSPPSKAKSSSTKKTNTATT